MSHATVVNNNEKVSIVRRLLLALHASGVHRVEIMPDHFGIGERALKGLRDRPEVVDAASLIDMPIEHTAADSLRAAQYLCDAGAGCIVVLGGDGTCRVVAKGAGEVPLLPLSTGTNNVVPHLSRAQSPVPQRPMLPCTLMPTGRSSAGGTSACWYT